jgi:two-component system chemotaxis response regulator CheY
MGPKEAVPKRILVVDDEPGVRRLLSDLLASEGYLVSEAADGVRGLVRLREACPDVVILDLMMPVMSGWAFAEECQRIDGFREVPIIAISAMCDIHSSATTLHGLGVRAVLAKPFDVDVLLSLVATLL